MLFNEVTHSFLIGEKEVSFSTGKFARKAGGSVYAQMGGTVILVAATVGKENDEQDFFPLTVEYVEKMAAAGIISSSRFVKRERFPSDEAILKSRIIDRSLRPRFKSYNRKEVQLIVEILSYDKDNDPLILAVNAASAALMLSNAGFNGPISAVRIIKQDGKIYQSLKAVEREDRLDLNLVIAGDGNSIVNIDADSNNVIEDDVLSAFRIGLMDMESWLTNQKLFADKFKEQFNLLEETDNSEYEAVVRVKKSVWENEAKVIEILGRYVESSGDRYNSAAIEELDKLQTEKKTILLEQGEKKAHIDYAFDKLMKSSVYKYVKENNRRVDGRGLDEIREVACEIGVLPKVHGSGLFTRGMTQVLTIATLGTLRRQQTVEDMTGEESKKYMHFYSQYPFTLGEVSRMKYMPGRRDIGHGSLAEKALLPMLPSTEEFPYAIVLNSEILSENGSSSMGSICGSSLALVSAGVPIKDIVAGVALGVFTDEEEKDFIIATDIRDIEDFYGYMDFKVAGTKSGITAIQMDTKTEGLPLDMLEKALDRSKEARLKILEEMGKVIPNEKLSISPLAPRVMITHINTNKIGELIGPGGKNIKSISEQSDTEMEIEDDGTVMIYGKTDEAIRIAMNLVKDTVGFDPVVGEVYSGKVASVMEYGVFVELAPSVSGLIHNSELKLENGKRSRDLYRQGDKITVKVLEPGDNGKLRLSNKNI